MTKRRNDLEDIDEYMEFCSSCHKDVTFKVRYEGGFSLLLIKYKTNANLLDPDELPEFEQTREEALEVKLTLCRKCHKEFRKAYNAWEKSVDWGQCTPERDCDICNAKQAEIGKKKYSIVISTDFFVFSRNGVKSSMSPNKVCFCCPKCFQQFMQRGVNLFRIYGFSKASNELERVYKKLGDTRKFPLF